jgi:exosome complex RNA-binding protein Rrp4
VLRFNVDFVIISAVNNDGTINLHIRSTKFGKLHDGVLVEIEPSLIHAHAKHMVETSHGVKVILAVNGRIWIQGTEGDGMQRVRNIVELMGTHFIGVSIDRILELINATSNIKVQAMGNSSVREMMLNEIAESINKSNLQSVGELIRGKLATSEAQDDFAE